MGCSVTKLGAFYVKERWIEGLLVRLYVFRYALYVESFGCGFERHRTARRVTNVLYDLDISVPTLFILLRLTNDSNHCSPDRFSPTMYQLQ